MFCKLAGSYTVSTMLPNYRLFLYLYLNLCSECQNVSSKSCAVLWKSEVSRHFPPPFWDPELWYYLGKRVKTTLPSPYLENSLIKRELKEECAWVSRKEVYQEESKRRLLTKGKAAQQWSSDSKRKMSGFGAEWQSWEMGEKRTQIEPWKPRRGWKPTTKSAAASQVQNSTNLLQEQRNVIPRNGDVGEKSPFVSLKRSERGFHMQNRLRLREQINWRKIEYNR